MKFVVICSVMFLLVGCVSGAPKLTAEQQQNLSKIEVFKTGSKPNSEFIVVGPISAADCSGPGGSRLYGDEGKAMDILLAKAAALGADAITNVSCGAAPLVNNCWAAKKCDGNAVKFGK
jgi:hypothetical protein